MGFYYLLRHSIRERQRVQDIYVSSTHFCPRLIQRVLIFVYLVLKLRDLAMLRVDSLHQLFSQALRNRQRFDGGCDRIDLDFFSGIDRGDC